MNDSKELKSDSTPEEESPSGSKDLSKTLPEEAFNHFVQGKRHMLVQDYTFAVQSLATACELYVKHFGELALECGEVYFLYGQALFRLTLQSGVLVDGLNKGSNENDEEEGQSSDEEDKENESESGDDNKEKDDKNDAVADDNEPESEEKEPSESTDSPQNVDNESKDSKEKEDAPSTTEADVTLQNESKVEENQQESEEDDLETAWNILETAKSIFKRQGEDNREAQLKIAEILLLLAEISMESDNYAPAIVDLKECLSIQEKYLPPDDRAIAQTFYEMGLAYNFLKMYDDALESYGKTVKIIEVRKEKLKNTPVTETVGGFEAADRQKEIEEFDGILADLNERIEDTKELMRNAKNELQETIIMKEQKIENDFIKTENSESTSNSKPVSNITHLLKRKKPDHEEDKETDSKRIKISPSVQNGDTTVC